MTLAGFLLLVLTAGCMAVANELMKNGIVQAVRRFLSWSRQQHAKRVTVVTQGRNLAAQRLYQGNGFVTASLQLWYHRWFKK